MTNRVILERLKELSDFELDQPFVAVLVSEKMVFGAYDTILQSELNASDFVVDEVAGVLTDYNPEHELPLFMLVELG